VVERVGFYCPTNCYLPCLQPNRKITHAITTCYVVLRLLASVAYVAAVTQLYTVFGITGITATMPNVS
jgi:hypothetical protein